MNIGVSSKVREAMNSLRSARRNPHCAKKAQVHPWRSCMCGRASLPFIAFLLTSHPRASRRCSNSNPPTHFHVYKLRLEDSQVHFFSFPPNTRYSTVSVDFYCPLPKRKRWVLFSVCMCLLAKFLLNPRTDLSQRHRR